MAIFFSGLNGEEIVGTLYKKKLQKKKIIIIIIKKNLGLKKSSRENVINHRLIGKVMAILLKAGLIKNT